MSSQNHVVLYIASMNTEGPDQITRMRRWAWALGIRVRHEDPFLALESCVYVIATCIWHARTITFTHIRVMKAIIKVSGISLFVLIL